MKSVGPEEVWSLGLVIVRPALKWSAFRGFRVWGLGV